MGSFILPNDSSKSVSISTCSYPKLIIILININGRRVFDGSEPKLVENTEDTKEYKNYYIGRTNSKYFVNALILFPDGISSQLFFNLYNLILLINIPLNNYISFVRILVKSLLEII